MQQQHIEDKGKDKLNVQSAVLCLDAEEAKNYNVIEEIDNVSEGINEELILFKMQFI